MYWASMVEDSLFIIQNRVKEYNLTVQLSYLYIHQLIINPCCYPSPPSPLPGYFRFLCPGVGVGVGWGFVSLPQSGPKCHQQNLVYCACVKFYLFWFSLMIPSVLDSLSFFIFSQLAGRFLES